MRRNRQWIALDARLVTDHVVGISRYVVQLAEKLLHQADQEWFFIVNSNHLEERLRNHPRFHAARFIRARSKPLSLTEHLELPLLLLVKRISLYHATSYMTPILVPCRSVYSILDTYHQIFPQGFSRMAKWYFAVVVKTAAIRAKYILTISHSSKEDIRRHITTKTPIVVTHLGFDETEQIDKGLEYLGKKYHLDDRGYFFYVGNHRYHKNSERVLKAYDEFCGKRENPPLLVMNLPESIERRNLLTCSRAAEGVRFTGFIDEENLYSLYRHALGAVVPSLYEGFGLFLLEAMAAGTPVITSNVSSMPEIAGDAALYVDPYSVEEIALAMERIDTDADLRNRLIGLGRERLKLFSWERCAAETLCVYRRALDNSTPENT